MLDPWYVTGFADGEAAFTYSRAGGSFGIYFAIKQREDNRQIVEEIHNFFGGVGYIYRGKESNGAPKSGFSKPYAYYRVTKSSELQKIVEHFDKYPLQSQKKHEAYQVWREMVIHKRDNYRNIDYNRLSELAGKLSILNLQSRAFKIHKKRWVK
ncbi:MAG: LAGLIDADG family homing endonuclease [Candidatus Omnitrophota bacterium]|nr:LAGLIDADG family homing endonuclease [Candidatus Omnitrophota bacterium]